MHKMEEGFQNMERNMAEGFKEIPKRMEALAKNGIANGGNEGHTQSFSSSFQSSMGKDGKMHKKESKQGSDMECHNGHCKGTVCKNGQCNEVYFSAKDKNGQQVPAEQQQPAAGFIVEVPDGGAEPERPEALTREEFARILQKIKEHMEKNGMKGDVAVKIVPMGKAAGPPKKEENVPPPPPSFAPKNK